MEKKVQSFLEWSTLELINFVRWGNPFVTLKKFDSVHSFYSQPFTPAMIVEFFEGWEKDGESYWIPYKSSIFPMISFNCELRFEERKTTVNKFLVFNIGCWQLGKIKREHLHFHYNSPPVLTLDDFIRDCARAGINLNWKMEIINKYINGNSSR